MRRLLLAFTALAASLALAPPAAAAPTWLPPVNLGAETLQPSSIGRVALGGDGTAVAAWAQSDGAANWVLQAARRKPGQGYGPVVTVPGTSGAGDVRVAVDAAGNATIVALVGSNLIAVPWPAASAAPEPVQPLGSGGSPAVAVGRQGTAVATWIDAANPNAPQVRAAVRPGPSGSFGASKVISDLGNGPGTVTGLGVTVGDGGHAAVIWSRKNLVPNVLVEVNERAPGGAFSNTGTPLSNSLNGDAVEPTVVVDRTGRATALWTNLAENRVKYAERVPGQSDWSGEQTASRSGDSAAAPAAGLSPSGTVVAAWVANGAVETAVRTGGGAFAAHRLLSGPSMDTYTPLVAVGANGDALIGWNVGMQEAVYTVQRKANGSFSPLLKAVTNENQPAGENRNFFEPSLGMDDEGNGVAAWTQDSHRSGTDHFRFQTASFDAAAPTLTSSVPPNGTQGLAIGMAATAGDRVSPVSIAWAFGDGATGAGGAVTHAFATAGAFDVTVTATDAAGNATAQTHPVLVAVGPPPPRIDSSISTRWAFNRKRVFLLRMKVNDVPDDAKAVLSCKPKKKPKGKSKKAKRARKCPFKKRTIKRIRKGDLRVFKTVKAKRAVKIKSRRFKPGHRLTLRVTAPGYIGKAVRFPIKRRKIPTGKVFCLNEGSKKPRKSCP